MSKKRGRGQASVEYVMVVGFALLMLIPVILIFGSERENIKDRVYVIQAGQIAQKVADSADKVHFMGRPSQTTLKVDMPYGVDSIQISGREITIFVKKGTRQVEVVGLADVNMSGIISPKPGIKEITLVADINQVNVSST